MDLPDRPGLRERKKEKTRLALEHAALTLFAEKGFDGTTVDEIVEACDVSQRTFFRYYGAKEDVLFADGDERLEALLAEIAARPADEVPVRAVQAAFRSTTADYADDRERLLLRSRVFDGSSSLRSHRCERLGHPQDRLDEATRLGVRGDPVDEGLVDLEHVDRQLPQPAER